MLSIISKTNSIDTILFFVTINCFYIYFRSQHLFNSISRFLRWKIQKQREAKKKGVVGTKQHITHKLKQSYFSPRCENDIVQRVQRDSNARKCSRSIEIWFPSNRIFTLLPFRYSIKFSLRQIPSILNKQMLFDPFPPLSFFPPLFIVYPFSSVFI